MEYASVVPAALGVPWLPWWAVLIIVCIVVIAGGIYVFWKALDVFMIDPSMYPGPVRHTNE